jgi:hypothetical protein
VGDLVKTPRRRADVRARRVAGKICLSQNGQQWELSDSAGHIWSLCDGSHTIDEISAIFGRTYGIARSAAREDVAEFLELLHDAGCLEVGAREQTTGDVAVAPALPLFDEIKQVAQIPDDHLCVFLGGSHAIGGAHTRSDVDIYVVTREQIELTPREDCLVGFSAVALTPERLPVLLVLDEDPRWDVEFWTESQVQQLIGKFRAERFRDVLGSPPFSDHEVEVVNRFLTGSPLSGVRWLRTVRGQILASDLKGMILRRLVAVAELRVDDALGQLAAGDVQTAVLCARAAFDNVVTALTAQAGDFSVKQHLQALRMRKLEPAQLSWNDYWAWQTMARYSDANAEQWVRQLVDRCRDLILSVDLPREVLREDEESPRAST